MLVFVRTIVAAAVPVLLIVSFAGEFRVAVAWRRCCRRRQTSEAIEDSQPASRPAASQAQWIISYPIIIIIIVLLDRFDNSTDDQL